MRRGYGHYWHRGMGWMRRGWDGPAVGFLPQAVLLLVLCAAMMLVPVLAVARCCCILQECMCRE